MSRNEIEHLALQDFLQPELLANPYPTFRRLRFEDPVHWDEAGQGWIVSCYDDVVSILADRQFSAERLTSAHGIAESLTPLEAVLSRQMLFLDPPDHTRIRGMFAQAFTLQRTENLRLYIEKTVTELLDLVNHSPQFDFLQEFAVPLPVTVIAEMFGVPECDRRGLCRWSLSFGKLISGCILSPEELADAQESMLRFRDYFSELVIARRRRSGSDMISDLLALENQEGRLSLEELLVNVILLLAAGHGTTTHLLGNGLVALLRNRDQFSLLQADPALAGPAVTELLRYEGPVQATSRQALNDVQIKGRKISKHQQLTVLLGSANRDSQRFLNPDILDLRRQSATRSLAFGHGIHACIGGWLARVEGEVAFREIARRFSNIDIECEELEWTPSISFRGLQKLEIRLR